MDYAAWITRCVDYRLDYMANERCAECGYNFGLFGRVHRCVPIAAPRAGEVKRDVERVMSAVKAADGSAGRVAGASSARSGTYRYREPEKRRAQVAAAVRRYRARRRGG